MPVLTHTCGIIISSRQVQKGLGCLEAHLSMLTVECNISGFFVEAEIEGKQAMAGWDVLGMNGLLVLPMSQMALITLPLLAGWSDPHMQSYHCQQNGVVLSFLLVPKLGQNGGYMSKKWKEITWLEWNRALSGSDEGDGDAGWFWVPFGTMDMTRIRG
ncbi:hypothetical protein BDQ17DRAFT_1335382 [Cyathus striatus]|nr:hypothetical protein BDQ17DRAFT_1335382 [Cyathus striatus]